MMKPWLVPAIGALLFWGVWGFLPKLTTQYISPKSAVIYEVMGAIVVATLALTLFQVRPEVSGRGMALAATTGVLGVGGTFCFLTAVSRGPLTLVAPLSALYPLISIILAIVILQEPLTLRQALGIALALGAMILVAV